MTTTKKSFERSAQQFSPTQRSLAHPLSPRKIEKPSTAQRTKLDGAGRKHATFDPRRTGAAELASFSTQLADPSSFHARVIGKVFSRFGDSWYVATGWLTGKAAMITSAAILYDPSTKTWADEVIFELGHNNGQFLAQVWAKTMTVRTAWQNDGRLIDDFGGVLLWEETGNQFGWLGWWANYPIVTSAYMEYGYPQQPVQGYPFDGAHLWRTVGQYDYDYSWLILAAGNQTGGAQGGPWVLNVDDGVVNGMTCAFTDTPDVISPYFGDEFLSIIASLRELGAMD